MEEPPILSNIIESQGDADDTLVEISLKESHRSENAEISKTKSSCESEDIAKFSKIADCEANDTVEQVKDSPNLGITK